MMSCSTWWTVLPCKHFRNIWKSQLTTLSIFSVRCISAISLRTCRSSYDNDHSDSRQTNFYTVNRPNPDTKTLETGIDHTGDNSPAFKAIAPDHPPKLASTGIVPGKGPPPEPPIDCCMSGCANCVWIQYAENLTNYYRDGGDTALKEIEKIENPGLRAFIRLEIGT